MAGNLTIFGGNFQDAEAAPLDAGYLLFELSHDAQYTIGSSQIVAGLKFRITLDSTGNIPVSPAVKVYSNDVMLPSGSFYIVRAFKSDGTEAWGAPQYWQLSASPNPLDVGTIVPANPPGSGLAGSGGATLLLQTNEANNGDQSLLDLHAGAGITLTDNGSGRVTVTNTGGTTLQVNGTLNADQTLLNFIDTTTIAWSDNGGGAVSAVFDVGTAIGNSFDGLGNPIVFNLATPYADTSSYYVVVEYEGASLVNPGFLSVEYVSGSQFKIYSTSTTDASLIRVFHFATV